MPLTPLGFVILRCQINRVSSMARLDWSGDPEYTLPTIATDALVDSATLIDATAWAAGYVLTMWEISALRGLRRYPIFNQVYDNVQKFIDDQTLANLEAYGTEMVTLMAAACDLRKVAEPCPTLAIKPFILGLTPLDPQITSTNFDDLPSPPPPVADKSGLGMSRKMFGYSVLGGMGLATLGCLGIALFRSHKETDVPNIPKFER